MPAVVLVLILTIGAVLPARGAHFRGKTAQGGPISFAVSRGAPRLEKFSITVAARCPTFSTTEQRVFAPLAVRPDGTFSGVSRDVPTGVIPQGDVGSLFGRFVTPRRASGTLVLLARHADPETGVSSCTLHIPWTAAAR